MNLDDADCQARFPIRDRDNKLPALLNAILADASIQVVHTGIQMPRMNSLWSAGSRPAATNCSTAP
jgi:putative transposase